MADNTIPSQPRLKSTHSVNNYAPISVPMPAPPVMAATRKQGNYAKPTIKKLGPVMGVAKNPYRKNMNDSLPPRLPPPYLGSEFGMVPGGKTVLRNLTTGIKHNRPVVVRNKGTTVLIPGTLKKKNNKNNNNTNKNNKNKNKKGGKRSKSHKK